MVFIEIYLPLIAFNTKGERSPNVDWSEIF